MEETILRATVRTESPKKIRNSGFTPGVLNESDTTSTAVQFDTIALNKVLARHGSNAKIWVSMETGKRFGYIKEVQKHPVEAKVLHVSIQLLTKGQEVKMHLPITFHGRDGLEHLSLQLQVLKSEIEVEGIGTDMPDTVMSDLTAKKLGDTITAADFNLPKGIRVLDAPQEIYAVIKAARAAVVEEVEEVKPVEA